MEPEPEDIGPEEKEKKKIVRQAMSILGSLKTPNQTAARRRNIASYHAKRQSEGVSEKTRLIQSAKQKARRDRERQERIDAGLQPAETVKRPRGRPRKQQAETTSPEGMAETQRGPGDE